MPITSDDITIKPPLGRSSKREPMTKLQARKQATYLVSSNKISPDRYRLIAYLSVAGCLTTNQIKERIGLGLRTLQRCFYDSKTRSGHVLDYHRGDSVLTEKYGHTFHVMEGLRYIRVWTLGVLGREIARELGFKPVSYNGFSIKQLTHDLLCNAIVLQLLDKAKEYGYESKWLGKNEARLVSGKKIIIEPDALLIFTRNKNISAYCVELHNERGKSRTKKKYKTYQDILGKREHINMWGLEYSPSLLVYGHTKIIIDGYADAMPNYEMNAIPMYYRNTNQTLKTDLPQSLVNIRHYKKTGTTDRKFDPDAAELQWDSILTAPPQIKTKTAPETAADRRDALVNSIVSLQDDANAKIREKQRELIDIIVTSELTYRGVAIITEVLDNNFLIVLRELIQENNSKQPLYIKLKEMIG